MHIFNSFGQKLKIEKFNNCPWILVQNNLIKKRSVIYAVIKKKNYIEI